MSNWKFSNFKAMSVPFVDEMGISYKTSEHAYQAAKSLDINQRRAIAACLYPGQAKKMGRTITIRPDWDMVKVEVMTKILLHKYTQCPEHRDTLLNHEGTIIEHNYWHDVFWGVCLCRKHMGAGQNRLGMILMDIRAKEQAMKYYAGIGSRSTPSDILELMVRVGAYLAKMGYTLISGGAPGADTAFEQGCDSVGGPKIIYIPRNGFQGYQANGKTILIGSDQQAVVEAAKHHMYWARLSRGAQLLMARNTYQVLDHYLSPRAERVVCWTPDGATTTTTTRQTGGTGQAIRIAAHHGIPVFNLALPHVREMVENKIGGP